MAKENGTAVVAFDMNRLGMDDLEDFVDAARGNKFRDAAAVMAKCCTRCPEAWGSPDDPKTFYKRPPVGEWAWKDVVGAMMATINSAGE